LLDFLIVDISGVGRDLDAPEHILPTGSRILLQYSKELDERFDRRSWSPEICLADALIAVVHERG